MHLLSMLRLWSVVSVISSIWNCLKLYTNWRGYAMYFINNVLLAASTSMLTTVDLEAFLYQLCMIPTYAGKLFYSSCQPSCQAPSPIMTSYHTKDCHQCSLTPQHLRSTACALLSDHGYLLIQAFSQALQSYSWGFVLIQSLPKGLSSST